MSAAAVMVALIASTVTTACAPLPVGPHAASMASDGGLLGSVTPAPPKGVVSTKGWLLWRVDTAQAAADVTLCFTPVKAPCGSASSGSASSSAPSCDGVPATGDAPDSPRPSISGVWRWEAFALAGLWDGEAFTPTSIVPMNSFDAADISPFVGPDLGHGPDAARTPPPSAAELEHIAALLPERLGDTLLFVRPSGATSLRAQVVWDDGTLQHAADVDFGDGVVTVVSALQRLE